MVIINSFQEPDSRIIHQEEEVHVFLDKKDLGVGTLYVSERTLCWNEKDTVGFSLNYTDISLHAISRDRTVHSNDCVYLLVDSHFNLAGMEEEIEDRDSDQGSEPDVSEVVLVPRSPETIMTLYNALKICQGLNPDEEDVDEDDAEDNMYVDAEDELDEGVDVEGADLERAAGDIDVDNLTHIFHGNRIRVNYSASNGHDLENGDGNDDEFEDAD